LWKLIISYYEDHLGISSAALLLDAPNLTAATRDGDEKELIKLVQVIIALAVQSDDREKFIQKIRALETSSQHRLMVAIEQVSEYTLILLFSFFLTNDILLDRFSILSDSLQFFSFSLFLFPFYWGF